MNKNKFIGTACLVLATACVLNCTGNYRNNIRQQELNEQMSIEMDESFQTKFDEVTLKIEEQKRLEYEAEQKRIAELERLEKLRIEEEKRKQEENNKRCIGEFRISFYCPCATCNGSSSNLTASGAQLSVGTTIAVDKNVIPLGTRVYIDGIGWRVAQDTGSAIKGNRIDVLVSSHSEAYENGIKHLNVYVKS